MNTTKHKFTAVLMCLFLALSSIAVAQDMTNTLDSMSYSVGVLFGKGIKQQGVTEVNEAMVAKAINDYLKGEVTVIPEGQCETMYRAYVRKISEKKSEAIIAEGKAFLAENAKRPEVITTLSGLQYEVLTSGTGQIKPTVTDKVKTHYHGTLIDGTVFDSSVDRGSPISFSVGGVIKGWTEALQLMNVGDKWKLYVPSELAYGARGAGRKIPPHATLIFEVELLNIE